MPQFLSDIQLPKDPDAVLEATTKQYVDAATDALWVGTDAPVNPATELWYDTDDPGTSASLTIATADPRYVNVSGDTMTGALTVPVPAVDGDATNKYYVDFLASPELGWYANDAEQTGILQTAVGVASFTVAGSKMVNKRLIVAGGCTVRKGAGDAAGTGVMYLGTGAGGGTVLGNSQRNIGMQPNWQFPLVTETRMLGPASDTVFNLMVYNTNSYINVSQRWLSVRLCLLA